MSKVARERYLDFLADRAKIKNQCSNEEGFQEDIQTIFAEYQSIIINNTIEYASTWLLDRDIWVEAENKSLIEQTDTLSRGRVISANPGVANIGREQRFIHPYIVLGEFKETFIGIPITNMAFNRKEDNYYLRNIFEVELKNPVGKKPYNEFRVNKPSVADLRNISGLDKRRIIKNQLYYDRKFAPSAYMNDISNKIRDTIAIIIT
jgi:hypothetical protein